MQRALFLVGLILFTGSSWSAELVWDFRESRLNQAPEGFLSSLTGSGRPGQWEVILDDIPSALPPIPAKAPETSKRRVLAQLSRDPTDERNPLLIFQGETFGDFRLRTQFKIVAGEVEQMAGIAFRIQNETNYYYIRASALGKNISFFKRLNGQLIGPIGSKREIPTNTWHELVIDCHGNEIRCQLDGQEAFPAINDNSFNTGRLGFWTKSDAVSYFADTQILFTRKEPLAQALVREALKKYPRLVGLKIYAAGVAGGGSRLIAGTDAKELGKPGGKVEADVIAHGRIYYLKEKGLVEVTMPLRDCNGEIVAATRVIMKSFAEQSEKNAITRAMPIIRSLESGFQRAADLTQ